MPSHNYPKNVFEQIDIELCMLERKVKDMERAKGGYFPTYNTAHLPRDLHNGSSFFTTQGQFCTYYEGKIYCMPGVALFGVGPTIMASDYETVLQHDPDGAPHSYDTWVPQWINPPGSTTHQRIHKANSVHDDKWTTINPVPNWDFTKLAYFTWGPGSGQVTAGTSYINRGFRIAYVAILDIATGVETIIDSADWTTTVLSFSPDGKKLAYGLQTVESHGISGYSLLRTYHLETHEIHELGWMRNPPVWTNDSEYVIYDGAFAPYSGTILMATRWDDSSDKQAIVDTYWANYCGFPHLDPTGTKIVGYWDPGGPTDAGGIVVVNAEGYNDYYVIDFYDIDWPEGTSNRNDNLRYPGIPSQPFWYPSVDDEWILFTSEAASMTSPLNYRRWQGYRIRPDGTEPKVYALGTADNELTGAANPPYSGSMYAMGFSTEGIVVQADYKLDPYKPDDPEFNDVDYEIGNGQLVTFDFETGEGNWLYRIPIIVNSPTTNFLGTVWNNWWHTGMPHQTYYNDNGA